MATVLVRTSPDEGDKFDYVGIFSIGDDDFDFDLYSVIDEICNPTDCQYLVLPTSSGIFFDLETIEETINNETYMFNIPVRPKFSELLDDYMADGNDWKSLCNIDIDVGITPI